MSQQLIAIAPNQVSAADLEWWLQKIPTLDWVFAVTYADGAPHEYVVADRTPGLSAEDCARAVRVIRTFGEPAKFFKDTRIYLVDDHGWKYWDMAGDDVSESGLINRGRAEHVYGVQNAPITRTGAFTPYDAVATQWNSHYSANEAERHGITTLVSTLTNGYEKCRTLDIGCGTGLALDLEITESTRYVGIDPSRGMLNELVRRYPHPAAIHPMTFAVAHKRQVLAGTRFDLVLALGGSGSYLSRSDLLAVFEHAKGRVLLSAYAEGESPEVGDLDELQLESARDAIRALANQHVGRIERIGRFDTLVVNAI